MQIIIGVAALALLAVCALRESKLTGLYKANHAYGRITAYLALSCTGIGIVCVLSLFVPPLKTIGLPVPAGLAALAVGVLLYARAFMKCPQPLRAMCIPSMIMSGLGVALKICLFFLPAVWAVAAPDTVYASGIPETIQDASGHTCRTRVDGDFIYITRPDGSETSVRRDYVDAKTKLLDAGGDRYHW